MMSKEYIDIPQSHLSLCCPECGSDNVKRRFIVPVSNYGHLPNKKPLDICSDCRFESNESFSDINFRNNRDRKIEQILKEDGI